MKVSDRGGKAQASPIRRLAPYADEAVKSGAKVYYLNIGQPDLPTPENVMERIRSYPGKYVPYSPSAGIPESPFPMCHRARMRPVKHRENSQEGKLVTSVAGSREPSCPS